MHFGNWERFFYFTVINIGKWEQITQLNSTVCLFKISYTYTFKITHSEFLEFHVNSWKMVVKYSMCECVLNAVIREQIHTLNYCMDILISLTDANK